MGSSSENFHLTWNDYSSNVSSSFRVLRNESDFFDVLLTCDDTGAKQKPMNAHKVILSACSELFKSMLRVQASVSPRPVVHLRGVRSHDLAAVLNYIYTGEVRVSKENLNSFLAVAEDLQIKGLTRNDTHDIGKGGKKRPATVSAASAASPSSKKAKTNDNAAASASTSSSSQDPILIKDERSEVRASGGADYDPSDGGGVEIDEPEPEIYDEEEELSYEAGYGATYVEADYGGEEDDGGAVAGPSGMSGEMGTDPAKELECGNMCSNLSHAKRRFVHAKECTSVSCPVCKKEFKNGESLKTHLRRAHNIHQKNLRAAGK